MTLWCIWKMRNDLVFNNIEQNHSQVVIKSVNLAMQLIITFHRNLGNGQNRNDNMIKWMFPSAGKVKINTDGSSALNSSYGSYGGLARTDVALLGQLQR